MVDLLLEFGVEPVFRAFRLQLEGVVPAHPDLRYQIVPILDNMVGTHSVTRDTFCVAIILIPPCTHVGAPMEMTTVKLMERLDFATADALAVT